MELRAIWSQATWPGIVLSRVCHSLVVSLLVHELSDYFFITRHLSAPHLRFSYTLGWLLILCFNKLFDQLVLAVTNTDTESFFDLPSGLVPRCTFIVAHDSLMLSIIIFGRLTGEREGEKGNMRLLGFRLDPYIDRKNKVPVLVAKVRRLRSFIPTTTDRRYRFWYCSACSARSNRRVNPSLRNKEFNKEQEKNDLT